MWLLRQRHHLTLTRPLPPEATPMAVLKEVVRALPREGMDVSEWTPDRVTFEDSDWFGRRRSLLGWTSGSVWVERRGGRLRVDYALDFRLLYALCAVAAVVGMVIARSVVPLLVLAVAVGISLLNTAYFAYWLRGVVYGMAARREAPAARAT